MGSLYLHIPFCLSKCFYCSFVSFVSEENLYLSYVLAIKKEISTLANRYPYFSLDTLFIGGGTPTVLPVKDLCEVIELCKYLFVETEKPEITVEVNPGTVDTRSLRALFEAGVNRISFGVQSFNDHELQAIGRLHDMKTACDVVEMAQKAGFENISLDLMYGLPGQTSDSWSSTLKKAISLRPTHLSLYQLTIELGTYFQKCLDECNLVLPGEDEELKMDEITTILCADSGLEQYEISNYAIPGRECRHNINYWFNGQYLAVGAAAVSYMSGMRERRIDQPEQYINLINSNKSVIVEAERLTSEASFRETVIMGLRLVQGVSHIALFERFGLAVDTYYGSTLAKLVTDGLVELSKSHLLITAKGRPFANIIMAELV